MLICTFGAGKRYRVTSFLNDDCSPFGCGSDDDDCTLECFGSLTNRSY